MREGIMTLPWDDIPTKYIQKKEHGAIIVFVDIARNPQQDSKIYGKKIQFIHRRLCTSAYR